MKTHYLKKKLIVRPKGSELGSMNPFLSIKTSILSEVKESIVRHEKRCKFLLHRLGEKFKDALVHSIEDETLDLAPLTEEYKAYKKKNMLFPQTLIATGEYLNSIEVTQDEDGNVTIAPNDEIHEDTNISNSKLGCILEYGTKTIPPRPHWEPNIRDFTLNKAKKLQEAKRVARYYGGH